MAHENHESELRSALAAVRSRWRAVIALEAWTRFALAAAIVVVAALGPWWSPTGKASAIALVLFALASLAALAIWAFRPLAARLPDRRVARLVEEKWPELEDSFATAVDVLERAENGRAGALDPLVADDAARRIRNLDVSEAIPRDRLRRRALAAAVSLALFVASSAVSRDVVSLAIRPVQAAPPSLAAVPLAVPAALPAPPGVARIDLHYTYPAALDLEPRIEENGGDIYAPAGTRVQVRVTADRPVDRGSLELSDGVSVPLARVSGAVMEATIDVSREGSYRVELVSSEGVANRDQGAYLIRLLADNAPELEVLSPEGDQRVTRLQEVTVTARARDDYAVERMDLVYAVGGGPERVLPFAGVKGRQSVESRRTLYLEDLDIEPGDFITFYVRARDGGAGPRRNESRSDLYFLEVKPFEEAFYASSSQAAGGGRTDQIEEMIAAQKDIIAATWRLERESGAGLRRDDFLVVQRAQGELRARATSLASGQEAAGPGPAGGRGGSGGMFATAAAAMRKAEAALERSRAREAIPHELAALDALLEARGNPERSEVGRSTSSAVGGGAAGSRSGGGGSGREGARRDLSDLFDRELRKLETRYETPPAGTERREDRSRNADLERVRELARRQQALAGEQRDLAKRSEKLDAEEVRRELQRLTREQAELRREVEEMARQLSLSGGRGGASSAQDRSKQFQSVSDDMRQASAALRRDDPQSASQLGSRALGRLREMERELQRPGTASGRQPLGDLHAEARNLAGAQRQLARRAAALGPDKEATATDARRQLAGEQERLRERAGRLERDLADASRDRTLEADQREAAAREAARMREEAVAGRMQQLAESLRHSSAGKEDSAAAAERLAADLRKLSDRLAAAAPDDRATRQLAMRLEEARSARTNLEEAARRVDSLERQGASGGQDKGSNPAGTAGGGEAGKTGRETAASALERAREEYREALKRASDAVGRLGRQAEGRSASGDQMVRSAPGTEAFKQDRSSWDDLRLQLAHSLEQIEARLSAEMRLRESKGRLQGGSDTLPPEEYRKLVEDYYKAIARTKGGGSR